MPAYPKFEDRAISIGSGALLPYSEALFDLCRRKSKYGDDYSLAKVLGSGANLRIMVPRNMVTKWQEDLRVPGVAVKLKSSFVPRNEEQARVVNEAVQLLALGKNFMVEAPTGFGKTWCATDIIANVGKKTLVIGTKEDIRDQWIEAFESLLGLKVGKGIGLIQGDTCLTVGQSVVFAMIQSLSKEARYPESVLREFGFVVWDESGAPDTLVTTSIGQIRIQDLVRYKPNCSALSMNTATGLYEWREILAYHEHPPKNPMMRVTHEHGYLDFTSEHLCLTGRGWVRAQDLLGTDCLFLDTEHSFHYKNYKDLEFNNGSMATRDCPRGHLCTNWQDQSLGMGVKVRVLSVVPIATPDLVYDIEVSGNHNFIANGVVVHNCHRVGADHFAQSGFRVPALLRMGISATPDRTDGREEVLAAHIGPILVRSAAMPMTPRVIAQRSPWEVPYVRRRQSDGSFTMIQIPHNGGKAAHVVRMLANHFGRNKKIAAFTTAAYKKGRTILVQSDLKDHLDILHDLLVAEGVPQADIGFYVGGLTSAARVVVKETKRVILATYQMTKEATDIPWLDTLVMATPKSDVRQIAGRILRYLPDKKEPVIFDLFDNTSSVFNGYWGARRKWYASIGAKVEVLPE